MITDRESEFANSGEIHICFCTEMALWITPIITMAMCVWVKAGQLKQKGEEEGLETSETLWQLHKDITQLAAILFRTFTNERSFPFLITIHIHASGR